MSVSSATLPPTRSLRKRFFSHRGLATARNPPKPAPAPSTHPFRGPEAVNESGKAFFYEHPRQNWVWKAFSWLTMMSVGFVGKVFVRSKHRPTVLNFARFKDAQDRARREGRGIITVMNHVSILDDPLVWGATLPMSTLARIPYQRWTLAAKDICFRNRFESLFFALGRTLSVERFGSGPDQPGIDCAVALLADGDWVHIYPEGFVHQPYAPHAGSLRYFRWGISRLVLEPQEKCPLVVPIYATGLENVFPEDQKRQVFGHGKHVPLVYNFGSVLDLAPLEAFREQWRAVPTKEAGEAVRSAVASHIRRAVLARKQETNALLECDEDPRLDTPQFWKNQTLIKMKGLSVDQKKQNSDQLPQ